jgi:hypothetical protein
MALANYTDLQASVASWLHRTDLTTQIVDFIKLAESKINRLVSVKSGEVEASLTMTPGSRFIALPSDFSTIIDLWIETYQPRMELIYKVPSELPVNTASNSMPRYYTIDNSNIGFEIPADAAYAVTLRYAKDFQLSMGSPTNLLLTNYPDIYLYGALVESCGYTMDDSNLSKWQALFDRAVMEVNNNEGRNKAMSTLATELTTSAFGRPRFNINRGY